MIRLFVSSFLLHSLLSLSAAAKDHLLVIAGGHAAANNQISLEKNVLFFRKVAAERAPEAPLTEYFSSGNRDIRSVQFQSEKAKPPAANILLARLFGSTRYLDLHYRKHTLGEVDGATSPANVDLWFDENNKRIKPGDRVIVYATAHGGKGGDKSRPHNTRIHMWQRTSLDVRALQANLKKLPDDVPVVLVMAQCFSGGFAHAIFNETDPKSGDFETPVIGFFATVNSRESAGCTPDINEENYDEFSSHFWAAIRGRTRMEKAIENADYDGNDEISFEEAWAYTILTSRNIDIPMKTSGAFLRARSHYHGDKGAKNGDLLKKHSPYSEVLALADPVERRILESLSESLGLKGENRYASAEKKADEIEKKRAELKRDFDAKKRVADGHRNAIRDELLGKWPELSNLQTEQAVALVTSEAGEFVDTVKNHSRLKPWNDVEKKREAIDKERFQFEKEWAWHIRFLRTHNNVVLAENLRTLGDSDHIARFEAIRKAEKRGFGGAFNRVSAADPVP